VTTSSRTAHTPVLVLLDPACGYTARPARLRERLQAYLRADSLDRLLARGVPPEADPQLFLHARRLASPRTRRQLAQAVRRVLATHEDPPLLAAPSRPARDRVRRAHGSLERLAELLDSRHFLQTEGVARVRVLLADGSGPLYRAEAPEELQVELHRITAALVGA
jgi:hypothetical protein